ncbi:MAG: PD-(D/E)XK nuclease family protein [Muribaculaceae bacterium]|nr:PD-(D/E)XK nuclease family protein [Muribaculaceae bacterium]
MKFLHQVAAYFCGRATADNMAELIMVVPTRRSGLFLKKHFQKELAGKSHPVMMPRFHTMGRLIQDLSQCQTMPRDEQLFLLYEAYCETLDELGNREQARDFDRFAFWGDIILNDFNDIDNSLSDASSVFRNLKGLKEIAADFLTDEQKDIVRRLWGESQYTRESDNGFWLHFDRAGGDNPSSVRNGFIQLWQLLGPLYQRFHQKLASLGLATEGRQQRLAVKASSSDSSGHKYAFVGFSTLTNAEFSVMNNLRQSGKAQFFWDFGMLPPDTATGSVLNKFIRLSHALPAPDDFMMQPMEWPDKIECIAVPSNIGQSKYLSKILADWYAGDEAPRRQESLLDTALILPDEGLLPTTVLSLPHCVDSVNITLRLPYRSTTFASLLSGIIAMQLRARIIHGEYHFFYEDVERVLSHPHIHAIVNDKADNVLRQISAEKMYNIPASEMRQFMPELDYLFEAVKDLNDISEIHAFTIKLLSGLEQAFLGLSDNSELIEYRMLAYFREQLDSLSRLIKKYNVSMGENTYFAMFERLLAAKRIDLHGSPLKGLQIMGVLETRTLDFNRVVIASMNERIFPKKSYLRTMIPDSLRRAYGLNTEAEADASYTYYFYRLITGAKDVKLLYDNRSASFGAGEVSRFISQLRHLAHGKNIVFSSLRLNSESDESRSLTVPKDRHVLALLDRFKAGGPLKLSASSLKTYLSCPLKFYLQNVRGLRTDDEVNPYINAADYGTVVHGVMEYLYKPYENKIITKAVIDSILNTKGYIFNAVQGVMSDFLNKDRLKRGQTPRPLNNESRILCRVIEHFVTNVLRSERDSYCNPSFKYIKAEHRVSPPPVWQITPELAVNFTMVIDRIDEISPGYLRFIDYKTGGDLTEAKAVDKLFDDYSVGAIFQLLLYCEAYGAMVNPNIKIQPVVYNFTTITASGKIDSIKIGKDYIENYKDISDSFMPLLKERIEEIFNPDVPFVQCEENSFGGPCGHCPFVDLCGR